MIQTAYNDPNFDTIVRVDSAQEQYAYMTATFGAPGQWEVVSQTWRTLSDGQAIEVVTVRLPTSDTIDVRFGAVTLDNDEFEAPDEDDGVAETGWLDRVMEIAVEFSQANPPHHPGTIARFPVPAAGYDNALAVPMGLIAVDESTPGLYAPPRLVALDHDSLKAIGVGEFPGFDPELWPPVRVGDWPLPELREMAPQQLQGIIQRFSACWLRVVNAWFAGAAGLYRFLADDIAASLGYRNLLDSPAMKPHYERLNPAFAKWLHQNS